MPAPALITNITIPKDGSLSNAVDITSGTIIRMHVPPEWSSAPLSFLISPDNVLPYANLCNSDGSERILNVQPNSMILGAVIPGGWVKFRSGTSQKAIPQKTACQFRLALLP